MNPSNYHVRRATLDDINELTALWGSMGFAADDLSKRITEFQVALDSKSKLLGAVGLQIAERQGRIHSEAFSDFALADHLRPLLWDRIQAVATNHGLLRLWTQEQAPFWSRCGMVRADPGALERLPAAWRNQTPGWLMLKLKEEIETAVSLDKEFALFMESEKQQTQKAFQQARIMKAIATAIAIGLLMLIVGVMFVLLRKNPGLLHR